MSIAFSEMSRLSQQVVEADAVGSRSFCSFYRVSFYGHLWGADLDGKSFIYKADEFSHVAEVTEVLEKQFKAFFASVERLGNREVQKSELQPDKCYWQIGAVKEYFDESEVYDKHRPVAPVKKKQSQRLADLSVSEAKQKRGSLLDLNVDMSRVLGGASQRIDPSQILEQEDPPAIAWNRRTSKWERKFNVNRFIMVQPFTKGKKEQSEGRPEDQWTRKTIFTTEVEKEEQKKIFFHTHPFLP